MRKLSTGDDSTLGNYLALCTAAFGKDSAQATFINQKIAASANGEKEEVIADEGQMLQMLVQMRPAK